MLQDLYTIARARRSHLNFYMFDSIIENAASILLLTGLGALVLLLQGQKRSARVLAVGGAAACACGFLMILGNFEPGGFPLAVFIAILVASAVTVRLAYSDRSADALRAIVVLLASVYIFSFIGVQAFTLPWGAGVKLLSARFFDRMDAPALRNFVPIDDEQFYTNFVNDGIALLRKHVVPGETVMSLDFSNPFSFGLGLKPAEGGTTVLAYETTFDDWHRQSPERLFGSADLVMVPQPWHFSDGTLTFSIPRLYGPYLESHFSLIGQSEHWRLYRRLPQNRPLLHG
ncbi:MAG: hypothetical protein JO211_03485 [Acidobacteriaceae bacterium]|nr:hypothetical protein [Acidobacteriaceae bacterium]